MNFGLLKEHESDSYLSSDPESSLGTDCGSLLLVVSSVLLSLLFSLGVLGRTRTYCSAFIVIFFFSSSFLFLDFLFKKCFSTLVIRNCESDIMPTTSPEIALINIKGVCLSNLCVTRVVESLVSIKFTLRPS